MSVAHVEGSLWARLCAVHLIHIISDLPNCPAGCECYQSQFSEKKTAQRSCGESNGTPLQYPCLENPMDGGA